MSLHEVLLLCMPPPDGFNAAILSLVVTASFISAVLFSGMSSISAPPNAPSGSSKRGGGGTKLSSESTEDARFSRMKDGGGGTLSGFVGSFIGGICISGGEMGASSEDWESLEGGGGGGERISLLSFLLQRRLWPPPPPTIILSIEQRITQVVADQDLILRGPFVFPRAATTAAAATVRNEGIYNLGAI
mmetsp:Transcript_28706/g.48720  ORF Transcript_28706/g.48720 Transcript_28706/m.48720 type:complete len:189 (+) Transcript_28706:2115-2681(+)